MPHTSPDAPAPSAISRTDRERLSGQKAKVVWISGLSGAGKSTLAQALDAQLRSAGARTCLLDGELLRQGISRDLGYSRPDRLEHTRRVAEMARLMMDAGLIVIVALISPFRRGRQQAKELLGPDHFIEVHMSTPLATCMLRDPKGLYRRAQLGEVLQMSGIDSPYEAPEAADFSFDTTHTATAEHLARLLPAVLDEGQLPAAKHG